MKQTALNCVCVALAASLAFPAVTHAQATTFANVVNTTNTVGASNGFSIPSSINSEGEVAFRTFLSPGGQGVYKNIGDGSTSITIADGATNGGMFNNFADVSINSGGVVAFRAFQNDGRPGIFFNSGASTTASTIADTESGVFNSFGNPFINAGGTVVFRANLSVGEQGIFTNTNNNGTAQTIADTSGLFSSFGISPTINGEGTVAFVAGIDGGEEGVFTCAGAGSAVATIANTTTTNGGAFTFLGNPSIVSNGKVAFVAGLDGGGQGVFTNTSGSPMAHMVANSTTTKGGAFSHFGNVSINGGGIVAFNASLDVGFNGIFAALPGSSNPFPVIQVGDPLFGSFVNGLVFGSGGLNDNNTLAFNYLLTDGRSGVAVAQIGVPVVVPEPGTVVFVACGLLAGAGVVLRRKK